MFNLGVALLVVAVIARTLLADALVSLNDLLVSGSEGYGLAFLATGLVATFSTALGVALVAGALVLQGVVTLGADERKGSQGRSEGADDGP
ncbi:hypothetical protein KIF24_21815 [Micromonospora sp. Llam7]|uniref:hypothetical protein n=1 Tax=Micromonospora tarapacensis TaxID=2835305 RepID=UPI001C839751|nr:hypothetical protein [Micromonospora tarapacensis]MBX7268390.1 hypothetical protein [Micromonospora tarapacensis]